MARKKGSRNKAKTKTKTQSKSKTIKTKLKTKGRKASAKKTAVKRKKKVSAIPKGYHSITPYLIVDQAAKAIEFYKKAFGAKENMRMEQPGGKVGHAELTIGDAKIMLSDECPEMDARAPKAYGGSPMMIHLYVKNSDAVVEKAAALGAKIIKPVADMFYGDRSGMIQDPFGYKWCVSTHVEDVTKAQLKKRMAEMCSNKYDQVA